MNRLQILAILCCAAFASCTSFDTSWVSENTVRGVELSAVTTEDGTREVWRAYPGQNTNPRLDKSSTRVEIVPHFGISVSDVDRERAEATGAIPWQGVWVTKAIEGGPAERAGIVRGDIVLQVDGEDVTSSQQFAELLVERGVPDEPLSFRLRQQRRPGSPIGSDPTTTASVTPVGKKVRKATTDSIPLDHSEGVQNYTGLQVAAVDAELAGAIFGDRRAVALVTGVITGSPAYYAGLRAGDRVVRVDGKAVESIQDVRDAVLARVQAALPMAPTFDLGAPGSAPRTGESSEEAIQIEVEGPLGAHQASLTVSDSIAGRSRFYIPIVVDYASRANRSKLGFLNFIFQFGFNYSSRVLPSKTRAPVETSHLSILPLGMFRVRHGVASSDYTLFWLIHFGSDR